MYGSKPGKSFGHGGSIPKPPQQPEWRLSSQPSAHSHRPPTPTPLPAPPAPSAPSSYDPNAYGPMPGAGTTTWGIRYNHNSHIETPPPLPPRPPSSVDEAQTQIQSLSVVSPVSDRPLSNESSFATPSPPLTHQAHWRMSSSPHTTQESAVPPPPPPVPPGYREELLAKRNSQVWHQPQSPAYQNTLPSHPYNQQDQHYSQPISTPLPGNWNTIQGQPQFVPSMQAASIQQFRPPNLTISPIQGAPIEQQNAWISPSAATPPSATCTVPRPVEDLSGLASPTASALGGGFPSDWEHFGPPPNEVDNTGALLPPKSTPEQSLYGAYAPPGQSIVADMLQSQDQSLRFSQQSPQTPFQTHDQVSDAQSRPEKSFKSTSIAKMSNNTQALPHRTNAGSVTSNYSEVSTEDHSENIDNVIDAWSRPVSMESMSSTIKDRSDSVANDMKVSPTFRERNSHDAPEIKMGKSSLTVETQVSEMVHPTEDRNSDARVTPIQSAAASAQTKIFDPYEDLDPWSKSSLVRFVAMLRKEAVADSDEERFKIFTGFAAKEIKLREILYSIEPEPNREVATTRNSVSNQSPLTPKASGSPVRIDSRLIPEETSYLTSTAETQPDSECEDEDDFQEGSYSPGGRPVLRSQSFSRKTPHTHSSSGTNSQSANEKPDDQSGRAHAEADNNSSFAQTSSFNATLSGTAPDRSAVTNILHKSTYEPLTTNPPQPIYMPFRYKEGPQRGSDNLAFDLPAHQAYSALRQASAGSGRVLSIAPMSAEVSETRTTTPGPAKIQYDEAFIGLIRAKSLAYNDKLPRRNSPTPPLPEVVAAKKQTSIIEDLRSMVSKSAPKQSDSYWNLATRKELEKLSDDFSYVQAKMDGWEQLARERRDKLETERIKRQEESEANIDDLFNEKVIGYADINILEEDFRQAEARTQLDEERQELNDFIANVFEILDARLKDEISKLKPYYETVLHQLDPSKGKGTDMTTEKQQVSQAMKIANEIHKHLDLRYQKRLEIALDRERRRNRAERRPLVVIGDPAALKQLDGDFDRMGRQNVLGAAKIRDDNANRLMDVFDDAVMRGLGQNQKLLDEISEKIKKFDLDNLRMSGLPDSEIEQILRSVSALVTSLLADSECILQCFGEADSTLNDADYTVSVAEARCSYADADIFRRLQDEKKKEDAKIQTDLQAKLHSVRKHPRQIVAEVEKLVETWSKPPAIQTPPRPESAPVNHPINNLIPGPRSSSTAPTRPGDGEIEHQERLKKALEDAKKRNAGRNHSNTLA